MNDLDNICRVCLASDLRMFRIEDTGLLVNYELLTNTKLFKGDGKPEVICYLCHALLRKCNKFLAMAQNSEWVFMRFLGQGIEVKRDSLTKLNLRLKPNYCTSNVKPISIIGYSTNKSTEIKPGIKQEIIEINRHTYAETVQISDILKDFEENFNNQHNVSSLEHPGVDIKEIDFSSDLKPIIDHTTSTENNKNLTKIPYKRSSSVEALRAETIHSTPAGAVNSAIIRNIEEIRVHNNENGDVHLPMTKESSVHMESLGVPHINNQHNCSEEPLQATTTNDKSFKESDGTFRTRKRRQGTGPRNKNLISKELVNDLPEENCVYLGDSVTNIIQQNLLRQTSTKVEGQCDISDDEVTNNKGCIKRNSQFKQLKNNKSINQEQLTNADPIDSDKFEYYEAFGNIDNSIKQVMNNEKICPKHSAVENNGDNISCDFKAILDQGEDCVVLESPHLTIIVEDNDKQKESSRYSPILDKIEPINIVYENNLATKEVMLDKIVIKQEKIDLEEIRQPFTIEDELNDSMEKYFLLKNNMGLVKNNKQIISEEIIQDSLKEQKPGLLDEHLPIKQERIESEYLKQLVTRENGEFEISSLGNDQLLKNETNNMELVRHNKKTCSEEIKEISADEQPCKSKQNNYSMIWPLNSIHIEQLRSDNQPHKSKELVCPTTSMEIYKIQLKKNNDQFSSDNSAQALKSEIISNIEKIRLHTNVNVQATTTTMESIVDMEPFAVPVLYNKKLISSENPLQATLSNNIFKEHTKNPRKRGKRQRIRQRNKKFMSKEFINDLSEEEDLGNPVTNIKQKNFGQTSPKEEGECDSSSEDEKKSLVSIKKAFMKRNSLVKLFKNNQSFDPEQVFNAEPIDSYEVKSHEAFHRHGNNGPIYDIVGKVFSDLQPKIDQEDCTVLEAPQQTMIEDDNDHKSEKEAKNHTQEIDKKNTAHVNESSNKECMLDEQLTVKPEKIDFNNVELKRKKGPISVKQTRNNKQNYSEIITWASNSNHFNQLGRNNLPNKSEKYICTTSTELNKDRPKINNDSNKISPVNEQTATTIERIVHSQPLEVSVINNNQNNFEKSLQVSTSLEEFAKTSRKRKISRPRPKNKFISKEFIHDSSDENSVVKIGDSVANIKENNLLRQNSTNDDGKYNKTSEDKESSPETNIKAFVTMHRPVNVVKKIKLMKPELVTNAEPKAKQLKNSKNIPVVPVPNEEIIYSDDVERYKAFNNIKSLENRVIIDKPFPPEPVMNAEPIDSNENEQHHAFNSLNSLEKRVRTNEPIRQEPVINAEPIVSDEDEEYILLNNTDGAEKQTSTNKPFCQEQVINTEPIVSEDEKYISFNNTDSSEQRVISTEPKHSDLVLSAQQIDSDDEEQLIVVETSLVEEFMHHSKQKKEDHTVASRINEQVLMKDTYNSQYLPIINDQYNSDESESEPTLVIDENLPSVSDNDNLNKHSVNDPQKIASPKKRHLNSTIEQTESLFEPISSDEEEQVPSNENKSKFMLERYKQGTENLKREQFNSYDRIKAPKRHRSQNKGRENKSKDNEIELNNSAPSKIVHPMKGTQENYRHKKPDLKAYQCSKCDTKFAAKENLNDHLKFYHSRDKPEYSCSTSKRKYQSDRELKLHQERRRSSPDRSYSCDSCQKIFSRRSSLKIHTLFEHEPDDFK